jgi:hypothetical protein
MTCSPKSPKRIAESGPELLTGGAVRDVFQPGKGDLSDWVELMEAVEALCPVWPPAANGKVGRYRL